MSDQIQGALLQHLDEAHAAERALARTLRAQVLVTPRGEARAVIERHIRETDDHAERLAHRMSELGHDRDLVGELVAAASAAASQVVALATAPFTMLRGADTRDRLLRNITDDCGAEAFEIAAYTTIVTLAEQARDHDTEELARAIREDEQRTLDRLLGLLPGLARAAVDGHGELDEAASTGAAEAVRDAGATAVRIARGGAQRAAAAAREVDVVADGERRLHGLTASPDELPIARYDELSVSEVTERLDGLSQAELVELEAYERSHSGRTTVLSRIGSLRSAEPWDGYDGQTVAQIRERLADEPDAGVRVVEYERRHKNRSGVLDSALRVRAAESA